MVKKEVHSEKAPPPMIVSDGGNVTVDSLMAVADDGIIME